MCKNDCYNESEFEYDVMSILAGWCHPDATALETSGSEILTFAQAGIRSNYKGLVIRLGNGFEYQMNIVQTKSGDKAANAPA